MQSYFSFFLVLLKVEHLCISAIVRAPLSTFLTDQVFSRLYHSSAANLHQMHENIEFADSIPTQTARNFISAPKNSSKSYVIPLTSIDFKFSISYRRALSDSANFS